LRLIPGGAGAAAGEAAAGGLGPTATALGTAAAAVAAVASVALAVESARAASQGEKTPIDIADEYYHTHFGDIWGWVTGQYSSAETQKAAQEKQRQLDTAGSDCRKNFDNSLAKSPMEKCASGGKTAGASSPTPAATPLLPVMPSNLSAADEELWKACAEMHREYKDTQQSMGRRSADINKTLNKLANNQPVSSQERLDLCDALNDLIESGKRLHKQRKRYIDKGCDKFDWFNLGATESARRKGHQHELDAVDKQIKNLRKLREKYCDPGK
jgi:hypothetical protein